MGINVEALIIVFTVFGVLALLMIFILHIKPHDMEKEDYSQSPLFNAEIQEDTKSPEEIFEALERDDINSDFLGLEEKE